MNRTEAKEKAAIMLAWADGADIEYQRQGETRWRTPEIDRLVWDWAHLHYRVKPPEMSARAWVQLDGQVCPFCRSHDVEEQDDLERMEVTVWQTHRCHTCKKTFHKLYTLNGYADEAFGLTETLP